jgi:hypothetical protein
MKKFIVQTSVLHHVNAYRHAHSTFKPASQGGGGSKQTWRPVEVRALIAVKRAEKEQILAKTPCGSFRTDQTLWINIQEGLRRMRIDRNSTKCSSIVQCV